MIKRKQFILGFLAFCLTATLFVGVTSSGDQIEEDITQFPWTKTVEYTNPATTSVNDYDPWCDMNEDGKITITDIVIVALRFGTTGNPTKNVTIMHRYFEWYGTREIELLHFDSTPFFETAGYRQVSIHFWTNGSVDVYVVMHNTIDSFTMPAYTKVSKTYDVMISRSLVRLYNPSSTKVVYMTIKVYVTT